MNYEKYKKILQGRLKSKRYEHSLCVADEAKRLANIYGSDPEQAYLAGLLHDITKNTSAEEQLQLFERFGIMLTDIEKNAKKLWHAISGSAYVREVLGISDVAIIDAIRYHTTARAEMTLLDKILYLADYTSADRDYNGVEIMRELVDIGFEPALEFALSFTITDLVEKKMPIHPDTLAAYNELFLKKHKQGKEEI